MDNMVNFMEMFKDMQILKNTLEKYAHEGLEDKGEHARMALMFTKPSFHWMSAAGGSCNKPYAGEKNGKETKKT